jgi:hypothetical protein
MATPNLTRDPTLADLEAAAAALGATARQTQHTRLGGQVMAMVRVRAFDFDHEILASWPAVPGPRGDEPARTMLDNALWWVAQGLEDCGDDESSTLRLRPEA